MKTNKYAVKYTVMDHPFQVFFTFAHVENITATTTAQQIFECIVKIVIDQYAKDNDGRALEATSLNLDNIFFLDSCTI